MAESNYEIADLNSANHDLGKLYIALEAALQLQYYEKTYFDYYLAIVSFVFRMGDFCVIKPCQETLCNGGLYHYLL